MPTQPPSRPLFAARLLERREALKLTQDGLGEKVGVDYSTVSKWENEGNEPEGLIMLMRLAHALHVTVDWLLGMPDAPDPPLPRLKATTARRLLGSAREIVRLIVALTPEDAADEGGVDLPAQPLSERQAPRPPSPSRRGRRGGTA